MKLLQVTSYNVRNGSKSTVLINPAQITTVHYGDILQYEEGEVNLACIHFVGAESIYLQLEDLQWIVSIEDPKPVPKPVPVPKVKAKVKAKKEKKNETS